MPFVGKKSLRCPPGSSCALLRQRQFITQNNINIVWSTLFEKKTNKTKQKKLFNVYKILKCQSTIFVFFARQLLTQYG